MCYQVAYDTLSSCISSCFSNGNSNIKTANFVDYQKSCTKFGFNFGPPIKDEPKNDLITVFTDISLLALGGLLLWYWYNKRSKKYKHGIKPSNRGEGDEPPQEQEIRRDVVSGNM